MTATVRVAWNRLVSLHRKNKSTERKNQSRSPSQFSPPDRLLGACGIFWWENGVGDFVVSWKSLFFYLCTNHIWFAPLRSQGADARAEHIQRQMETMREKITPCSPKAIYSLAAAVRPHDPHPSCLPIAHYCTLLA